MALAKGKSQEKGSQIQCLHFFFYTTCENCKELHCIACNSHLDVVAGQWKCVRKVNRVMGILGRFLGC
jgi:hypothetical protein